MLSEIRALLAKILDPFLIDDGPLLMVIGNLLRTLYDASQFIGTYLMFAVVALAVTRFSTRRRANRRFSARSVFRLLFPRHIYRHPSSRTDWQALPLFVLYLAMKVISPATSITAMIVSGSYVVGSFARLWGGDYTVQLDGSVLLALQCLVILIATDFAYFFSHFLFHKTPILWNFHRVHHSAEVLTPFTPFVRFHPVDRLVTSFIEGFVAGVVGGPFLYLLGQTDITSAAIIFGMFKILYNIFEPFRHSHLWISFGWRLSHVFISPCMHQIHHSTAPVHRDKNMGQMLAVWDRMFGTLYVPRTREKFAVGISEEELGANNPHQGVVSLFLEPFARTYRSLTKHPRLRPTAPDLDAG